MADKDEDLQQRLGKFLDKAAQAKGAREEEEKRRIQGPKMFADAFARVSAGKIRPILEEACRPWVERGLPAEVTEDWVSSRPSVRLNVEPNPGLKGSLVYEGDTEDRMIVAYRYFGPGAGDAIGRLALNDITREMVQSHVDLFLSEVMRLGGH
jgi:hypothetical protein